MIFLSEHAISLQLFGAFKLNRLLLKKQKNNILSSPSGDSIYAKKLHYHPLLNIT